MWPCGCLGRNTAGREKTAIAKALRQESAGILRHGKEASVAAADRGGGKRSEGQITQVLRNAFKGLLTLMLRELGKATEGF